MAQGDKYIKPSNSFLTREQLFRSLIKQDSNGAPFFKSGGGASVPSFDPFSYGSVFAWHPYNTGITLVSNGISQWADASGNGRHLTQSSAGARPNGTVGTAQFDGVDDKLTMGVITSPSSYTSFVLVKVLSKGSILGCANGMGVGVGFGFDADLYTSFGDGVSSTISNTKLNTLAYARYYVLAIRYSDTDGFSDIFIDGVKQNIANTGSETSNGFTQEYTVGVQGATFCKCEVVEHLIYDEAIVDSDVLTISNAIMDRVAVPLVGQTYTTNFQNGTEYAANWTQTTSFTRDSNGLTISGATGDSASYKIPIGVEDWEVTGSFDVTTIAGSVGFDMRIIPSGGSLYAYGVALITNGGASHGKIQFLNQLDGLMSNGESPLAMTILDDDIVYYILRRTKNILYARFYTSDVNFVEWSLYIPSATFSTTSFETTVGKMSFIAIGGTYAIKEFTVKLLCPQNPKYLFLGDSISMASFVSYYGLRFQNIAIRNVNTFTVCAGPGETTTVMLNRIPEILTINPENVIIMAGVNDLGAAVPINDIVANIQTIVTAVEGPGINVVIIKNTPWGGGDVLGLISALVTAFGPRVSIDLNTALLGVSPAINAAYSADGLHLNDPGAVVAGGLLQAGLPS